MSREPEGPGSIAALVKQHGIKLDARWRRGLAGFRRRGIETVGQLDKCYPKLSDDERFVAICLFIYAKKRKFVRRFLQELSHDNPLVSGTAAAALSATADARELPKLLRMAQAEGARTPRINALYALAYFSNATRYEDLVDFFLEILRHDGTEEEVVVGIAIDGLFNALSRIERRSTRYQRGIAVLMALLDDQRALCRILAANHLASLRVRRAIPRLKKLTDDRAAYPGLGSVSRNVREAIKEIERPERD